MSKRPVLISQAAQKTSNPAGPAQTHRPLSVDPDIRLATTIPKIRPANAKKT